jgi:type I restriction enzyme R subunit
LRSRHEKRKNCAVQADPFPLLDKYADHGAEQFAIPEILEVPPIPEYGNVAEIVSYFGGVQQLRNAVSEMQRLLYAA